VNLHPLSQTVASEELSSQREGGVNKGDSKSDDRDSNSEQESSSWVPYAEEI